MKKTDDYELFDKDFDEFVRRGLEAFGLQDHPGREGYKPKGRDTE